MHGTCGREPGGIGWGDRLTLGLRHDGQPVRLRDDGCAVRVGHDGALGFRDDGPQSVAVGLRDDGRAIGLGFGVVLTPAVLAVLPIAFIAGILTILAPCTLPVVPLVVGATAGGGGRRVAGVIVGFGATFVAVTVLLAAALATLGVTTDVLRLVAAAVLALAGAAIALPRLAARAERGLRPVAQLAASRLGRVGQPVVGAEPLSEFAVGATLGAAVGLLWAPCVGPIMAGVIAVASVAGPIPAAVAVALAYVAGAAVPLLVVARWGRSVAGGVRASASRRATRAMGVLMAVTAIAVACGWDVTASAAIGNVLPAGWSSALLAVEQQPAALEEVDAMREPPSATIAPQRGGSGAPGAPASPIVGTAEPTGATPADAAGPQLPPPVADALPASAALEHLGAAPEVRDISTWINSDPLTLASLRGKVVLVQFWTFACINCQHVQPYVKAWYERYASAGFVVLAVHTPELSFERNVDNVRQAVVDKGVTFPVAVDPDFATWNAYRNSYWPAFYFVDKAGEIRHVHFGEGDYAGSEQVIRELLAEPG